MYLKLIQLIFRVSVTIIEEGESQIMILEKPLKTSEDDEITLLDSAVFESSLFREHAEMAISQLEAYLSDTSTRGLKLMDPSVLLKAAQMLMTREEDSIAPFNADRFHSIIDLYIKTGIQVHSPGYMGRQFSGVIPLAGVFDLVNSIVNQPSSFYEAAQLPSMAERIMADELNRFIGFDKETFTMVTTSGGSLANLTALLAARNNAFVGVWKKGMSTCSVKGLPAIAVGDDAHYSFTRAAGILGIGEDQIVRLPLNQARQICVEKVQATLDEAKRKGLCLFCLVASAGTTAVGAFDDIDQLAEVAKRNSLWLHVDGSHGASLLVSDQLRHKLKGIEKADSLAWDAHKMLFVPSPCSLLFYKNKEKSLGAFHQKASYVFEDHVDIYTEYDSAEKNFECTKRPMIMNLWVLWSIYGRALFSQKIDYLCQLTTAAYHVLSEQPDFETIHQPESNILCFRYKPLNLVKDIISQYQVEIRNRVRKNGLFFISKVDINNEAALRVVFMNHEIQLTHFKELLFEIRKNGQAIISEYEEIMLN